MKSTGIVRKVDNLGRIVLPMELRKTLDIAEKDALEIFTDGKQIVLKKYAPGCTFCGSMDSLMHFGGAYVCKKCRKAIVKGASINE